MNAIVDITNVRLETERLILRFWTMDDIQDFYDYCKVDGVGQAAGWQPHENIETSEKILTGFIKGKKTFALEEKATGRVIGSLGIEPLSAEIPGFESKIGREIGYVLAKDKWGQGLMTEAARRAIEYCLNHENYDYLLCCHKEGNERSKRVMVKCGFEYNRTIEREHGTFLYYVLKK